MPENFNIRLCESCDVILKSGRNSIMKGSRLTRGQKYGNRPRPKGVMWPVIKAHRRGLTAVGCGCLQSDNLEEANFL